ncbi:MAG TPA: acyl carrier protein [Candidatus Ornithocaccomicrobium faecavium]|uniref:Acyl carrier protein n=1 Tax=Candidatus Ornithocaccomicrobium faecavium TaxID=2840890 RepID=A0A9D1P9F8_9FIRM|nr:acyl carrier protein [Clostridiales bacterium]HIV28103.1 acyl carrier protein [Candidatus Ornithocaccomicrobium faecavium]
MIYDKVVEMIADQLSISKDKITRQSRLFEDLNADSANVMMLILDLEQEFGVSVEDDVLSNMRTVDDVVSYLEEHVGQ